jgi:hypothetical protein
MMTASTVCHVGVDDALLADDQLAADVQLAADLALDLDRVRDVELAVHLRVLADDGEQRDGLAVAVAARLLGLSVRLRDFASEHTAPPWHSAANGLAGR